MPWHATASQCFEMHNAKSAHLHKQLHSLQIATNAAIALLNRLESSRTATVVRLQTVICMHDLGLPVCKHCSWNMSPTFVCTCSSWNNCLAICQNSSFLCLCALAFTFHNSCLTVITPKRLTYFWLPKETRNFLFSTLTFRRVESEFSETNLSDLWTEILDGVTSVHGIMVAKFWWKIRLAKAKKKAKLFGDFRKIQRIGGIKILTAKYGKH